ncbi:MAG TPA: hypothetical protein VK081_03340 [Planctomycetota bacterium]|nr:hypothetical protein [Planctomycetota bacterium]
MRSVLVLLGTLLLVLVPARTGVAQPPAPRTERLAAHAERLLAARADLAQAAFEAGLWREAGMFVRAVVAAKPGHSVARLADELKAMPSDAFVRTYREAVEKHGSTFRKRVRQTLAPLADELVSLADEALAAGERELAEQWYARAYQVDSDNGKALQALRKFDYDAIFNYGVLPREDKKEARDVLRRLGGRFLQRDDLARELEYWSDAWGLQTKHYRFVANAAHGTVFAFAQACEDLYEAWEAFMTAHRQPLRALTKPSTVFLFASRIDYESVLRLRGEDPPDSSAVLGYYAPATKIGYFYYDEEFYAGDKTLLFETFYHEGAHQLFDLRYKVAFRGHSADYRPLPWVEEGFAVYLESLVLDKPGDGKSARFGEVVDDDLGVALDLAARNELMPLAEFAHLSEARWDDYAAGYPHAALVVHWLLHGDGGKRRGTAMELLVAHKQNGGLRKGTLFDLLGMTPEAAEQALLAHAAKLRKELPRRNYPNSDKR